MDFLCFQISFRYEVSSSLVLLTLLPPYHHQTLSSEVSCTDCRQSQADSSTFKGEIYVIIWRIQDFFWTYTLEKEAEDTIFTVIPRPNNLAVNTATYLNIETAQNKSCKATLLQRNGWLKEEESTGGINPSKCSSNRNWFLTAEGLG